MRVQKIRAIAGLQRHLRDFAEQHLMGVVPLSEFIFREFEKEEKVKGRRQLLREQIGVDFRHFGLTIASSVEKPPLGWIVLHDRSTGEIAEGPIDVVTWAHIADIIKRKGTTRCR